ncbi:general odorant-binding protein lush [Anopheles gambiae]|uniref:Odorant-binding protein 5 n=1 Tax=Anopheles coluzzii TaxID=1518534 RepID=A0A6E8W0H4_ANOCL|nr:general odorant-binding protein lush-like [Anopheles coluzzii]XP_318661.3 general odorant-binding protein lush [Anopheles gambiae]
MAASRSCWWWWWWDFILGLVAFFFIPFPSVECAMTRKQLINSMDMMRSACAPKFKVSTEMLDNLRGGIFAEDRELKCYTMCIAQMAGTMNKKGEINVQKTLAQMDAMLPPDMRDKAKKAIHSCRDVQGRYKDSCDKTFYSTKCLAEYDRDVFLFP